MTPRLGRLAAGGVRRFLLHVLPDGLQRIRYYGLLANRYRAENLKRCRELLGVPSEPEAPDTPEEEADETWEQRVLRLTGIDPMRCPVCGQGRLSLHQRVEPQPHRPEEEEPGHQLGVALPLRGA